MTPSTLSSLASPLHAHGHATARPSRINARAREPLHLHLHYTHSLTATTFQIHTSHQEKQSTPAEDVGFAGVRNAGRWPRSSAVERDHRRVPVQPAAVSGPTDHVQPSFGLASLTPGPRYVLGHEAMRRMGASNVLIVGLKGLGVEIGELVTSPRRAGAGVRPLTGPGFSQEHRARRCQVLGAL